MNEADAKKVLFIRAVEASDTDGKVLNEQDRDYSGRAALELIRWQAAEKGERPASEAFVSKRAELLTAKLAERFPKALRAFESIRWRPWIGVLLPVLGFIIGVAMEHVSDRDRINILAFPVFALVLWNAVVYLLLLVNGARALLTRSERRPGRLQRQLAGLQRAVAPRAAGPLAGALTRFMVDWTQRSSTLVFARAARVLHLSAALLALGIIAGLYVRGLVFEYRAGWDSTFLEANTVHGILAFLLKPAMLVGWPFPNVEEIARLRWSAGTGENAARWIHMYAVTAMFVVVLPRLILAGIARWRERRITTHFPLSLDEPYFSRVLSVWREVPARVRVAPYAYTPSEAACEGVQRLAVHLFGESVKLQFAQPLKYGDEDVLASSGRGESSAVDLVMALFNLASTPEPENHGVFLDGIKAEARGPVIVLVDESPYRVRLGAQPGTVERLAERRRAWTGLVSTRGLAAVFADLEAQDLTGVERELDVQLSRVTTDA